MGTHHRARESNANATKFGGMARRYLKLLLVVLGVFGSLISFPNALPSITLGWVIVDWIVNRKTANPIKPTWLATRMPGIVCLAVIGTKFPEPTWALGVFCGLFAIVLLLPKRTGGRESVIVVAGWAVFAFLFWSGAHSSTTATLDPTRPIVCLGDSLTDFGYPDDLRELVSVPVEDFGFNGYTTKDGVGLLPEIIKLNPQAVVVELGGHDYKDGEPRWQTRKNLIQIVETCERSGARVILVEIPRGLINDSYFGLERQIAREKDLELVPDTMIRRLIFWSPVLPPGSWVSPSFHNSRDGLHPNERGNKMMACYVLTALESLYGEAIRRSR